MCPGTQKPDKNIISASVHYVHLGGDDEGHNFVDPEFHNVNLTSALFCISTFSGTSRLHALKQP